MNDMNNQPSRPTPPQGGQFPPQGNQSPQTGSVPHQGGPTAPGFQGYPPRAPQGMPGGTQGYQPQGMPGSAQNYPQPQSMPPQYGGPQQQGPQQPVFSKNGLIMTGITIGVLVGVTVVVGLVLGLLVFLLGPDSGAAAFFSTFGVMMTQAYGAGAGMIEDPGAGFILTSTAIIFVCVFIILRKATQKKPLAKPIDLVMSALVASLASAIILTVIMAIIAASNDQFYFSWAGLLFGGWFWMLLLAMVSQRPMTVINNTQVKQNLTKFVSMTVSSFKAYGVAVVGFGVVFMIYNIIRMATSAWYSFGDGVQMFLLHLGDYFVTGPARMLGTPLSVDDGQTSVFQWGVGYLIPAIIIMILMAFVVAFALAIFRRGNESWSDLGIVAGSWFVIALITMWLSLTTVIDESIYVSAFVLLILPIFGVVADLLARFVVPYIAQAIPSLKQKWPYLTQATQAQKLFGAPAPQQATQQWGQQGWQPQQPYGYPPQGGQSGYPQQGYQQMPPQAPQQQGGQPQFGYPPQQGQPNFQPPKPTTGSVPEQDKPQQSQPETGQQQAQQPPQAAPETGSQSDKEQTDKPSDE